MEKRIARVGNSGGVVLPSHLMNEFGLTIGDRVKVKKVKNGILIRPAAPYYTLEELIKDMPCEEHPEIDWGMDVGMEVIA